MADQPTLTNSTDIEIVEPFVRLGAIGDEGSINLDQDTARALYVMAWAKFEKALGELNDLFDAVTTEQPYQYNRVKRLLWEADSLKQAIEVVYYMTAPPDDDDDDGEDSSPMGSAA